MHGATAAVVAVGAGGEFSAALDDGGHLWSWGAADRGQLGVGPTDDALFEPTEVRAGGQERIITPVLEAVSRASGSPFSTFLDSRPQTWNPDERGWLMGLTGVSGGSTGDRWSWRAVGS